MGYQGLLIPSTAILVSADVDGRIRNEASEMQGVMGSLVGLCDGLEDNTKVNASVAACSTTGGLVHLTKGSFSIASYVSIGYNNAELSVTLEGEGWGPSITGGVTKLKLAANANCGVVNIWGKNNHIRNLAVDGNKANNATGSTGVTIAADNRSMEWVYIYDCKTNGASLGEGHNMSFNHVMVVDCDEYGFTSSAEWPTFIDCFTNGNTMRGFNIAGSHALLLGCKSMTDTGYAFYLGDYATMLGCLSYHAGYDGVLVAGSYCTIKDGWIDSPSQYANNTYSGVRFLGTRINNEIAGMHIWGTETNKHKYSIAEDGDQDYSDIHDNDVRNNQTSPAIAVYGTNSVVRNNIGYKTENKGASAGTGAQQAIAHGLAFTPTRQQIALIAGSATATPYHSAAPDATNIYVTAGSGQAWYWATAGV